MQHAPRARDQLVLVPAHRCAGPQGHCPRSLGQLEGQPPDPTVLHAGTTGTPCPSSWTAMALLQHLDFEHVLPGHGRPGSFKSPSDKDALFMELLERES